MTDFPRFTHLLSISDEIGVFEHCAGREPRREHGYCVDDVSRALLVLARQPDADAGQQTLADICLAFLRDAQAEDGLVRNRRNVNAEWTTGPSSADHWGRALWGLGSAAARSNRPSLSAAARSAFENSARVRSPYMRAMAFAGLGAAEVLSVDSTDRQARSLLRDAVLRIGLVGDEPWPWPESRLRYANGAIPEVLILGGYYLDDDFLLREGLRLLKWLLALECPGGFFSVAPSCGWDPSEDRPGFDQQPIEVAALVDAAATAFMVTGEREWWRYVERGAAWFAGANDVAMPMVDARAGAGYDGLRPDGRNENCGAESTLAYLSVAQQLLASPAIAGASA